MATVDLYFVKRDGRGVVLCASCPPAFPFRATHVSVYDKTSGDGQGAWAVCEGHAPMALVAWGSAIPLAAFEASLSDGASSRPTGQLRDEPS